MQKPALFTTALITALAVDTAVSLCQNDAPSEEEYQTLASVAFNRVVTKAKEIVEVKK